MRVSLVNGNGYSCDKCHTLLKPDEVIRLNATVLSHDKSKACSGYYTTIGKCGLCKDCYNKLQEEYIKFLKPRK